MMFYNLAPSYHISLFFMAMDLATCVITPEHQELSLSKIMFISMGLCSQTEWISLPALPLSGCVTFIRLLNIFLSVMVIIIRYYMLCTHNSKVNRLNAEYMLLEDYLFTDTIPKITLRINFHQNHYGQRIKNIYQQLCGLLDQVCSFI